VTEDAAVPTGLRALLERRRVAVGATGAVVAVALALLWLVVVPEHEADGVQGAVLRYGHSACWALVALGAVLHAVRAPARAVGACAWAALACYVAFLAALVL
jgi:hypothetical protein